MKLFLLFSFITLFISGNSAAQNFPAEPVQAGSGFSPSYSDVTFSDLLKDDPLKALDLMQSQNKTRNNALRKPEAPKENNYIPEFITIDSCLRIQYIYSHYYPDRIFQKKVNGLWTPDSMVQYSEIYYPGCNEFSYTYFKRENNSWAKRERVITYWKSDNSTTILKEKWDKDKWVSFSRCSYIDQYSRDKSISLLEYWNKGLREWVNDTRIVESEEDPLNSCYTRWTTLTEKWIDNTWNNYSLEKYEYCYLTGHSYQQEIWVNNSWLKTKRFFNPSMVSCCTDTVRYQKWTGSSWVDSSRVSYVHGNSGHPELIVAEIRENNAWKNLWRELRVYTGGNRTKGRCLEVWQSGQWVKTDSTAYAYDAFDNAKKGEHFTWSDGSWRRTKGDMKFENNDNCDTTYVYNAAVAEIQYAIRVGVKDDLTRAGSFSLSQNYPNPFNPSTTINYSLAREGRVTITIYDALGRKVAEPVNEYKTAGLHSLKFDAGHLASGIYLYRMESNGYQAAKKFILIR